MKKRRPRSTSGRRSDRSPRGNRRSRSEQSPNNEEPQDETTNVELPTTSSAGGATESDTSENPSTSRGHVESPENQQVVPLRLLCALKISNSETTETQPEEPAATTEPDATNQEQRHSTSLSLHSVLRSAENLYGKESCMQLGFNSTTGTEAGSCGSFELKPSTSAGITPPPSPVVLKNVLSGLGSLLTLSKLGRLAPPISPDEARRQAAEKRRERRITAILPEDPDWPTPINNMLILWTLREISSRLDLFTECSPLFFADTCSMPIFNSVRDKLKAFKVPGTDRQYDIEDVERRWRAIEKYYRDYINKENALRGKGPIPTPPSLIHELDLVMGRRYFLILEEDYQNEVTEWPSTSGPSTSGLGSGPSTSRASNVDLPSTSGHYNSTEGPSTSGTSGPKSDSNNDPSTGNNNGPSTSDNTGGPSTESSTTELPKSLKKGNTKLDLSSSWRKRTFTRLRFFTSGRRTGSPLVEHRRRSFPSSESPRSSSPPPSTSSACRVETQEEPRRLDVPLMAVPEEDTIAIVPASEALAQLSGPKGILSYIPMTSICFPSDSTNLPRDPDWPAGSTGYFIKQVLILIHQKRLNCARPQEMRRYSGEIFRELATRPRLEYYTVEELEARWKVIERTYVIQLDYKRQSRSQKRVAMKYFHRMHKAIKGKYFLTIEVHENYDYQIGANVDSVDSIDTIEDEPVEDDDSSD